MVDVALAGVGIHADVVQVARHGQTLEMAQRDSMFDEKVAVVVDGNLKMGKIWFRTYAGLREWPYQEVRMVQTYANFQMITTLQRPTEEVFVFDNLQIVVGRQGQSAPGCRRG